MSQDPSTPPLDYARGAVVGTVSLHRSPDRFSIHIRSSKPMMWQAIAMIALSLIVIAIGVGLRFLPSRPFSLIEFGWIIVAITGLGWLIGAVNSFVKAIQPITIDISGRAVTLTSRVSDEIQRREFGDNLLVDVVVRRYLRLRPIEVVQLIFLGGDRVDLHVGTHHEASFITRTLAEHLNLNNLNWVDAGFPKLRWHSRVTMRIDPFGILIKQPSRGLWFWLFGLMPIVPLSVYIAVLVEQANGRSWQHIRDADVVLIMTGFVSLLAMSGAVGVIHKFRKRARLTLDPRSLHIAEPSVMHPLIEDWPTARIDAFTIQNVGVTKRTILIQLTDGSSAPALTDVWPHDALVLLNSLNQSLARAKSAAPPRQTAFGTI